MGNSGERQSIWYGNYSVGWRGQNLPYGREGLWRRGLGWVTWGGTKHEWPGNHKIRWLSREQRNIHRQPAGEGIAHIHGIGNKRFQKRQLGLGGGTLATRYTRTLTSGSWLISSLSATPEKSGAAWWVFAQKRICFLNATSRLYLTAGKTGNPGSTPHDSPSGSRQWRAPICRGRGENKPAVFSSSFSLSDTSVTSVTERTTDDLSKNPIYKQKKIWLAVNGPDSFHASCNLLIHFAFNYCISVL